jgi:hypothetical protein
MSPQAAAAAVSLGCCLRLEMRHTRNQKRDEKRKNRIPILVNVGIDFENSILHYVLIK